MSTFNLSVFWGGLQGGLQKNFYCEKTLKYKQWGIINYQGEEVLPCQYDEIGVIKEYDVKGLFPYYMIGGKTKFDKDTPFPSTTIVKDGVSMEYKLDYNWVVSKNQEEFRKRIDEFLYKDKRQQGAWRSGSFDDYYDPYQDYSDYMEGLCYDPDNDYDDDEMRVMYDNIN